MTFEVADTLARLFWCLTHFIGFVYIVRCWRIERKSFYLWFAASWLIMAAHSFTKLTLDHNSYFHLIGSLLLSPAASICGLIAFRRLFQYISKKVATIQSDGNGNYSIRTFEPYSDEGDRATPIYPLMEE